MQFHIPIFPKCARAAALALIAVLFAAAKPEPPPVYVKGSSVVAQSVALAVPLLRERGFKLEVIAEGGSTGGILSVAKKTASVGMAIRSITAQDRAAYPERRFEEYRIGVQAMAVIVPRDVWDSGVRSITRKQLLGIYENDIRNWKELGGEDVPIKFFSTNEGRGPWELFALWLYDDLRKAPLGAFERILSNEEMRNAVEFTAGSMGIVPLRWVDQRSTFALALQEEDGEPLAPTAENLASGKYPLARPLLLVTGERPTGRAKELIEFMLGEQGQELVKKTDCIPQAQLGPVPKLR